MSLRLKLSLAIVAVLGAHFLIDEAFKYWLIYPRFVAMEHDQAIDQLRRCCAGLSRELDKLATACPTQAAPLASSAAGPGATPPVAGAVACQKQDVDILVGEGGVELWRRSVHHQTGERLNLSELPSGVWPADNPLLRSTAPDEAVKGILTTEYGPLLVAANRIEGAADASRPAGTRVLGRLLDDAIIARLRALTDGELEIGPVVRTDLSPQRAARLAATRGSDRPLVFEESESKLCVSATVPGIDGNPTLWIETRVPRSITRQGHAALLQVSSSNLVLGVAAITLLLAGAREMLIAPLGQLTRHASAVAASGDLGRKLEFNRQDEIGVLARALDDMLHRLAEYRTRLADSSRQAGMAEVASGVLHNVGNVLNNVNVATDVLHESVRNSRAAGVSKAAGLLREHAGDLVSYIGSDPRGSQIPAYLEQLGEILTGEQKTLLDEIGRLKLSIDHMNQIVQAQRELARPVGTEEPLSASEVVESAVSMVVVGLQRHGIALETDIRPTPTALLDRQRLMQVLVNLLTNAKDALAMQPLGERRMCVRVRAEAGRARIEIIDNGIGIEPANQTRIFQNGFTTKQSGGGYGLHYCALVVQEMGGDLAVSSDGPGRGATAVLQLPLKSLPAETRA